MKPLFTSGRVRRSRAWLLIATAHESRLVFGRCGGYNSREMHSPRYLAMVALQFVALALSFAQTDSKNPLDEKIRQADALQE
jgi:hypothetical protein